MVAQPDRFAYRRGADGGVDGEAGVMRAIKNPARSGRVRKGFDENTLSLSRS